MVSFPRLTNPQRVAEAQRFGSPWFTHTVSLAAGASFQFDVARLFPEASQYLPLDYVDIVNNNDARLRVYFNGAGNSLTVPAYNDRFFNRPFYHLRIENTGSNPADDIEIALRRRPVA